MTTESKTKPNKKEPASDWINPMWHERSSRARTWVTCTTHEHPWFHLHHQNHSNRFINTWAYGSVVCACIITEHGFMVVSKPPKFSWKWQGGDDDDGGGVGDGDRGSDSGCVGGAVCRPPLIHSENPKIRYDLYCYRLDSFLSECVFEPPTHPHNSHWSYARFNFYKWSVWFLFVHFSQ